MGIYFRRLTANGFLHGTLFRRLGKNLRNPRNSFTIDFKNETTPTEHQLFILISHVYYILYTAYNKVLARVGYTLEDIPRIVHENQQLTTDIVPQLQSQVVALEQALTELLEEKGDGGNTSEFVGDGVSVGVGGGNLDEDNVNDVQPPQLKIEASSTKSQVISITPQTF